MLLQYEKNELRRATASSVGRIHIGTIHQLDVWVAHAKFPTGLPLAGARHERMMRAMCAQIGGGVDAGGHSFAPVQTGTGKIARVEQGQRMASLRISSSSKAASCLAAPGSGGLPLVGFVGCSSMDACRPNSSFA